MRSFVDRPEAPASSATTRVLPAHPVPGAFICPLLPATLCAAPAAFAFKPNGNAATHPVYDARPYDPAHPTPPSP